MDSEQTERNIAALEVIGGTLISIDKTLKALLDQGKI